VGKKLSAAVAATAILVSTRIVAVTE